MADPPRRDTPDDPSDDQGARRRDDPESTAFDSVSARLANQSLRRVTPPVPDDEFERSPVLNNLSPRGTGLFSGASILFCLLVATGTTAWIVRRTGAPVEPATSQAGSGSRQREGQVAIQPAAPDQAKGSDQASFRARAAAPARPTPAALDQEIDDRRRPRADQESPANSALPGRMLTASRTPRSANRAAHPVGPHALPPGSRPLVSAHESASLKALPLSSVRGAPARRTASDGPPDVGKPRQHLTRSARAVALAASSVLPVPSTARDETFPGTVDAIVNMPERGSDLPRDSDVPRDEERFPMTVRDPPRYAPAELADAIERTRRAGKALRTVPAGNARDLARRYYEALADLSMRYLFAGQPDESSTRASAAELLREIHPDTALFALIGTSASGWLGWSGRDTPGIVLAGRVVAGTRKKHGTLLEMQLAGKYPKRVQLLIAPQLVPVDQPLPGPGANVLVFGMLIENAEVQLVNYSGPVSPVPLIWGVPVQPAPKSSIRQSLQGQRWVIP